MSVRAWWKHVTERFRATFRSAGRANSADALGRRLRRKFILVAMGAVTVVLTLIIVGINVVNYSHVCKMADARLDYILAGKGGIDWTDEPKTDPGQDVGAGKAAAGDRVAVRAGHHCAQPLMEFLGIGSCCRASVAIYNTAEDVDALLENLENVRKVMGL